MDDYTLNSGYSCIYIDDTTISKPTPTCIIPIYHIVLVVVCRTNYCHKKSQPPKLQKDLGTGYNVEETSGGPQ